MDIYFSINEREKILKGEIADYLVEYEYKKIDNKMVYQIYLKGLKTENIKYENLNNSDTLLNPVQLLKNLNLSKKEFRFIIINKRPKLEDNNFIATFKEFNIINNKLFATVRRNS